MATKKKVRRKKIPVQQGKSKVGYKKPPEETQFKPGQSGNPNGAPVRLMRNLPNWTGTN
jgi:hypothetical protein